MNTVIKYDKGWYQALDQIALMVKDLPNDKLKNNYSFDGLMVDEWFAVSIYEGAFSSIAWREYWGNNCRILNRFFKLPDYRFTNTKGLISQETLNMIEQQLDAAKTLGFDCAFMSRETKTQAFNHYKKYLPQVWNCPKEKYRMTKKDYQHIAWTPINSNTLIMENQNG